jgi:hypothetical protein
MQDLDLYCRSYGDQKNFFHLRAVWVAQKTSSNIVEYSFNQVGIVEIPIR